MALVKIGGEYGEGGGEVIFPTNWGKRVVLSEKYNVIFS